jgi:uncharacterized protein
LKGSGFDRAKLREIAITLFTCLVVGFLVIVIFQRSRTVHLVLAAGSPSGESFILCNALKTVVERRHHEIKIDLLETGGTVENLKLLEDGRAAFATAQADVLAGPAARIVAVLYDDTFQLLTHRDSPIESFAALQGKTIALARTGGQFQSFLSVAAHFGLQESAFRFVGDTDSSADKAFSDGQADALFRVRALGDPSIERLVQSGKVRFVRIDHAAAMKIVHPAFLPAAIPAGAYMGSPAVPPEDLPSISVQRTLLAASRIDDETVRAVTGTLIDNRHEIAREIPAAIADVGLLLAQVRRPEVQSQLGPAIHPGALKFYEKDKPSFILAHADYMGLMFTVLVMVSSWIWELRAWLERQQKKIADEYSNRVIALIDEARQAKSLASLEAVRNELLSILTVAVGDLDNDKLSEESFDSFRTILQIGLEVVRDNSAVLHAKTALP